MFPTMPVSAAASYADFMTRATPINDSMLWYCSTPGFISDRFESCIPNALQQVALMRKNFGPSADINLVDSAVGDFAGYLANSDYNVTIQGLEQQDRRNPFDFSLNLDWRGIVTPLVIGVAAVIIIKLVKGR